MSYVRSRMRTEGGFMGLTHALSAVAIILTIMAIRPEWITIVTKGAGTPYLILLLLVVVGGALMPDLDNTDSSAESALGFIGSGISWFMRLTAPIIQGAIHTKYDKDTENAHRGFYHTALAAALFGSLTSFLCSDAIDVPVYGPFHLNGKIIAIIIAFIGVHIALSTLGKPIIKKAQSQAGLLGFIVPTLLSAVVVSVLWSQLPEETDYTIIGIAFGAGWLIHELGDMCTTAGVPVLFPLPIRGHLWWNVRLLPIKAGGVIENYFFIPLFLIVSVVMLVLILHIT